MFYKHHYILALTFTSIFTFSTGNCCDIAGFWIEALKW
jgi:hypothetical protein